MSARTTAGRQLHVLVIGGIKAPQTTLAAERCRLTWIDKKYRHLMPDLDDNRRCQHIALFDEGIELESLIGICASIHRFDPFELVCSFHDEAQQRALEIARRLELPFGYRAETIANTRCKLKMREILARRRLTRVAYARVACADEVRAMLERHPAVERFVLKPMAGTGSAGVRALDRAASRRIDLGCDLSFPLLMEQYVEGSEYSVEAFTHAGRHHVIAITEKFKHPGSFIESGHLVPARIDAARRRRIAAYVRRCLSALEVDCGASHSEVIAAADRVELVETHTRVGGDLIPRLVKEALGVDLYRLSALQALGRPIAEEWLKPEPNGSACIRFLVQDSSGATISGITGVAEAERTPLVEAVAINFRVGDTLPAVRESFDRAGSVLAVGPDPKEVLAASAAAIEKIGFNLE